MTSSAQRSLASGLRLQEWSSRPWRTHRVLKLERSGRDLKVGGPALLHRLEMPPPVDLNAAADRFGQNGQAAIYLLEGNRALATIAVADAIRPESADAVRRLH